MAVKVVSDGPIETLRATCSRCMHLLEFTFEDAKPHRTDSDHDAIEKKGLYVVCPRSSCAERTWIGSDRAEAKRVCQVQCRGTCG